MWFFRGHEFARSSTDFFLNRNIYLKAKKAGGMKITFQATPKYLDEKMLYNILRDYKMLNCEVLVRDENGTLPSGHAFHFHQVGLPC